MSMNEIPISILAIKNDSRRERVIFDDGIKDLKKNLSTFMWISRLSH